MAYERFAYYYDQLMADMPYASWLRFAGQCWDKYGTPRSIVDLGCGTGSIAVPLARQGHEVIGIDLSENMLAVAQAKSEEEARRAPFAPGGSVRWLQQDIREWDAGMPVDAVISFCDCFNYLLEEHDVVEAIRRSYEALKPGGLFVFDMHTPYLLEQYYETQPFILNDEDVAYIWTCGFDAERTEIEHALTIFVKERLSGAQEGTGGMDRTNGTGGTDASRERFERIDEMHVQRAYPIEWIVSQLKETGFREIGCYADFLWKSPTDTTERAFFVALK